LSNSDPPSLSMWPKHICEEYNEVTYKLKKIMGMNINISHI